MRYILFVGRDVDGSILGLYQLTDNSRHNFKWWFGFVRSECPIVEISSIEE